MGWYGYSNSGTCCCSTDEGGHVQTTCTNCCAGEFPRFITVNIPGLAGTNTLCDNCAAIPTEYILEYAFDAAFGCNWQFTQANFCDGPCVGDPFTLIVSLVITKPTSCLVAVEWSLQTTGALPCGLKRSSASWASTNKALCNPGILSLGPNTAGIDDANSPCNMTYPTNITVRF